MNEYVEETNREKQNTINKRTFMRNIPSNPLQQYIDVRPISTKYEIMPTYDVRTKPSVPFIQCGTFDTNTMFNPGNSMGVWSGYATNIDNETFLLNNHSQYIPSSKSDLYSIKWKQSNDIQQPFPDLFNKPIFSKSVQENKIGYSLFNNPTRNQSKEI
jgi:hypothetical protein